MTIGVFALQGSFAEHMAKLRKLGVQAFEIRSVHDVQRHNIDGVILPGGESTTLMMLLKSTGLDRWLKNFVKQGGVVYGTCAGMIVCSKGYLNLIDVMVERNAYGSQLNSFQSEIQFKISNLKFKIIPGIFIRAPQFKTLGKAVEVLATHEGEPVLVQSKNVMVGSFHPELSDDDAVYQYYRFLINSFTSPHVV